MKEITIKALTSVANFFVSIWKKICDMSPSDTWGQQLCILIVIIVSTFVFIFGGVYFSIYCLKETGVIGNKRSHRPHITRTIEPQKVEVTDVGQTEN